MNLFQITNEYRADVDRLKNTDLPEDVIADTMEGMAGDLEDKAINYCYAIRELEAEKLAQEAIYKAHKDRADSVSKTIDNLKNGLFFALKAAGIPEIDRPEFIIKFRKNPESVVIDDLSIVPSDYFTVPVMPAPALDKMLVKQAIKDGYTVAGVHLERSVSLSIK